jgi:hypothetical protein
MQTSKMLIGSTLASRLFIYLKEIKSKYRNLKKNIIYDSTRGKIPTFIIATFYE